MTEVPQRRIINRAEKKWHYSNSEFGKVFAKANIVFKEFEELVIRAHNIDMMIARIYNMDCWEDLYHHGVFQRKQRDEIEKHCEWLAEGEIRKYIQPVAEYLIKAVDAIRKYGNDYEQHIPFANDIHELYAGSELILHEYIRCETEHLNIKSTDVDIQLALLANTNCCFDCPISPESAAAMVIYNIDTEALREYVSYHDIERYCIRSIVKAKGNIPQWIIPDGLSTKFFVELLTIDPNVSLKPFEEILRESPKIIEKLKEQFQNINLTLH